MKNKIEKFIIFVFIPLILILVWFGSSMLLNKEISFSVITALHSQNDIKSAPQGKLLKGESIKGEFRARENHLGLIILEFNDFAKHDYASEDVLTFKLMEKGSKSPSFIGTYRSGLLEHTLYFPFGFPIIDDSKDKVYEFTFTSLYGNDNNAVEFNKSIFSLSTGYQFPKSEITASKKRMLEFLYKKSLSSITDVHFLLGSILYMLPLIVYVFGVFFLKRSKNKNMLFPFLILIFILFDTLFLKEIYLGILLCLIIGWIFSIRIYKLESSVSFFLALSTTVVWVLLEFFKFTDYQNKLNVWVYLFFVIGLVQALAEEKNSNKKRMSVKEFFRKFYKLNEKL